MAASTDYISASSTSLTESMPLLNHQLTSFRHDRKNASHSSSSPCLGSIFSRGVICILLTVLLLSTSFFGIIISLENFATNECQLNLTTFQASLLERTFDGTFGLSLMFGSWLACSVFGNFSLMFSGCIISLTGAVLLSVGALSKSDEYIKCSDPTTTNTIFKQAFGISGLIVVAFGHGLIHANIFAFGADQLINNDDEAIRSIFICLYWFNTLGAFLAHLLQGYVQQEISYFFGYLISTAGILLSLIVLFVSKRIYQIRPRTDAANLAIVKEAIQKLFRPVLGSNLASHWLDRAKTQFGGNHTSWEVEYVKKVFRLAPILATFTLYFTVYFQMVKFMESQGQYMDINLSSRFQCPSAFFSSFDTISVLVLVPVMDKLVFPILRRLKINLSQLQLIGIGMFSATMSLVLAGGIESLRIHYCCTPVTRGSNNTNVSSISIFYQVPQYTLMGISQLFTIVTGFELTYSEEAETIQSVVIGCYFFTMVFGGIIGKALTALVKLISGKSSEMDKWIPEEAYINQGKLANYFFFLAGFMALVFLVYVRVAVRFQAARDARRRATYREGDVERTSHI